MSYVSDDKNYTYPNKSGVNNSGDIAEANFDDRVVDMYKAGKMVNLLEDLAFPATKADIENHINRKSPSMGNGINDVLEAVYNNLKNDVVYDNVF